MDSESKRLKLVSTVTVAGAERFCTKDSRKVANVGWTGSNFYKVFLQKVEENVGAAKVAIHSLEEPSSGTQIISELGDHAEIKLANFFSLLENQSKGGGGTLLTNKCANIAFIRGDDSSLYMVLARWFYFPGCWFLGAMLVDDPHRWDEKALVLSCAYDS